MQLKDFFASFDNKKTALVLGNKTEDALCYGFNNKRTIHAGLGGEVVSPELAQQVWQELLLQPAKTTEKQAIYIHIPFCQTKCLFCDFFQNARNQEAEDYYIDCLLKEMRSEYGKRKIKDSIINAVFIGGGTPSSLSPVNARRLLQELKANFNLANDYELTLEGRIHDLVPEKIAVWLENGVNRMSFGVQSFDTKVRQQMGRIDSKEQTLKKLALLKAQQQCSIVVDLIYGLPEQTMQIWQEDLQLLEEADVDGMDLYQLNVYENSALNIAIKKGQIAPAASTVQQAKMYAFAHEYLNKRPNYTRLSACHWHRDNRERSMYNTMVKQGSNIFPFGSSAGGNLAGYSVMLNRTVKGYEDLILAEKKPIMALMCNSPLQSIINEVLGQIEQGYINLNKLQELNENLGELKLLLEIWQQRNLLIFNGIVYQLTVAGQFWQVNLAQSILECVQLIKVIP